MMPAQSRIDAGIWSVPGHAIVIEYARPALKGILKHVIDGFDAYLAGGYEVGGVLFGQHSGNLVRISAFRPLPLEPTRPSFVLSDDDGRNLNEIIQKARRDPELAHLEVVGWYHSHTRSEIFLSESDIEIYDRYFPEPWQIAMVLRHTGDIPVSVGFFFREEDGFVRADQSYQEFAVESPEPRSILRREPPWVAGPSGEVDEYVPTRVRQAVETPAPAPRAPVPRTGSLLVWALLLMGVIAVASATYSILILQQPEQPLGLALAPGGNELIIRWDPSNPTFQDAGEANLLISDGPNQVVLPVKKYKNPYHGYKPLTQRVDVRLQLKLSWGRTRTEAATYVRHPDADKPSEALVAARTNLAKAEQQANEVRRDLTDRAAENSQLSNRLEELRQIRKELAAARGKKRLVMPPARNRQPAPPKTLPSAPEIAVRGTPVPLPPQNDLQLRPPADPPKPPPLTPTPAPVRPAVSPPVSSPAPAPVTVAPKPVPPSAPPTPAAPPSPASGRILWTGDISKGAALEIDGRKANRGFLNSELPEAPVRVGAYPAELTADGLKIYTGNPRYAKAPRTEPASAANGWQKTQYVYDPKAFLDVIVEKMPAPQAPRKMTLRAGRRLSLIVIEWQVVDP